MQRAFPLPVNIGTDICKVGRINDILTKHQSKYAHRFIRRVFTPQEQVWYRPRLLPLIEYLHFMERREFIQGKIEKQQIWRAKSIEALIGLVRPKETPLLSNTHANSEPVGSLIWSPYTTQKDSKKLTREEEKSMLRQLQQNVKGVARFIAGRFAAKEAAKKAFSKRRLGFHDITIDNPSLDNLRSRAPITLIKSATGREDQIVPMSISHDGEYATAVCLSCEDVAPPLMPDLQHIEPTLARLLDEITTKRLALNTSEKPSGHSHTRISHDLNLKDFTPEKPPQRFSTPLEKIPVKLMTPVTGRLTKILNSLPGSGSDVPTAEIKSDLNVSEASNPVQPEASSSAIIDPAIKSNLYVSGVSNTVQRKETLSISGSPTIRYHKSVASAFNSINVDLLNKSFNRNYSFSSLNKATGNQPSGNQPTGNQPTDNQPTGNQPTDNQITRNQPTGNQLIRNQPTGNQEVSYIRKVKLSSNGLTEGWANYIDSKSPHNKHLAESANYTGLPFKIDPAKEEEKRERIKIRLEKLQTRVESVYGLPNYVDPKIVRRNLDNCVIVHGLPPGATNEELIQVIKGECAGLKCYITESKSGRTQGNVIFSRKPEANRLRVLSKRRETSPKLRKHRLMVTKAYDYPKELLRDYANGIREWDWEADFWITNVFHAYNKEECDRHAQQRAEELQAYKKEERRLLEIRHQRRRVKHEREDAKMLRKKERAARKLKKKGTVDSKE